MGTIYYGLAGEGHGHAARATPIIEHLRQRHRVVVLTFDKALSLLAPRYAGSDVEVRGILGMQLHYGSFNRMSPTKTLLRGLPRLRELRRQSKLFAEELAREASLVISDFEPLTLRAAAHAGVPSLSIDHQRFLQACSFDAMPLAARAKIASMAFVIDHVYGQPESMLISGFHLPPLRPQFRHAQTVGPLIRRQIENATPVEDDHVLAYVRRSCPPLVLRALSRSPVPIRLYGLGAHADHGAIRFCPVSEDGFVADLASCRAVVTTAGNQLIGEAFHLRKPVMAYPEPGNLEQHINAHLLSESGGGQATSHRLFDDHSLPSFLERIDGYRHRLLEIGGSGNARVLQLVDRRLAPKEQLCVAPSRTPSLSLPPRTIGI